MKILAASEAKNQSLKWAHTLNKNDIDEHLNNIIAPVINNQIEN